MAADAGTDADADLPLGLYVHVPFCATTCDFCAFYQEKPRRELIDLYLDAVAAELAQVRREIDLGPQWLWQGEDAAGRRLTALADGGCLPSGGIGAALGGALRAGAAAGEMAARGGASKATGGGKPSFTVFFGGGTPGLLAAKDLERLCKLVRDTLDPLGPILEWSIELAPSTVKADKVRVLLEHGVTRCSLGVQSFSEPLLEALGRRHSAKRALEAYATLRDNGATNVNCDLMFALPGQSREDWLADLQKMCDLAPEHISTYCLTFEEDTALWVKLSQGRYKLDPEREAALYRETWEWLDAQGYRQYEVSNFAKPGYQSRHNLATWQMGRWRGVGPSGASQWGGYRFQNPSSIERWAAALLPAALRAVPPQAVACADKEPAADVEAVVDAQVASHAGTAKNAGRKAGVEISANAEATSAGIEATAANAETIAANVEVVEREQNAKSIGETAKAWPPAHSEERTALSNALLAADALIFGLRKRAGVNRKGWLERFAGAGGSGLSVAALPLARLEALFARLRREGMLSDCDECWRLTIDGMLLADAVGGEVMDCFSDEDFSSES